MLHMLDKPLKNYKLSKKNGVLHYEKTGFSAVGF